MKVSIAIICLCSVIFADVVHAKGEAITIIREKAFVAGLLTQAMVEELRSKGRTEPADIDARLVKELLPQQLGQTTRFQYFGTDTMFYAWPGTTKQDFRKAASDRLDFALLGMSEALSEYKDVSDADTADTVKNLVKLILDEAEDAAVLHARAEVEKFQRLESDVVTVGGLWDVPVVGSGSQKYAEIEARNLELVSRKFVEAQDIVLAKAQAAGVIHGLVLNGETKNAARNGQILREELAQRLGGCTPFRHFGSAHRLAKVEEIFHPVAKGSLKLGDIHTPLPGYSNSAYEVNDKGASERAEAVKKLVGRVIALATPIASTRVGKELEKLKRKKSNVVKQDAKWWVPVSGTCPI